MENVVRIKKNNEVLQIIMLCILYYKTGDIWDLKTYSFYMLYSHQSFWLLKETITMHLKTILTLFDKILSLL